MADQVALARRGVVLLTVHAQFPYPLTRALLERAVGPFYTGVEKDLPRDLAYLEGKGLLESESAQLGHASVTSYTCTPAGIDVVEGTVAEPGIVISRGPQG